jgi:hypothetical protein
MSTHEEPYEVGYAKPPRAGRFAKGRSGNPKGRPKGARSIETIFAKISRERIRVKTEKGTKLITKLEAAITQLSNKAASGDLRAIRDLVSWFISFQDDNASIASSPVSPERDQAVIANILERMRRADESNSDRDSVSTSERDLGLKK